LHYEKGRGKKEGRTIDRLARKVGFLNVLSLGGSCKRENVGAKRFLVNCQAAFSEIRFIIRCLEFQIGQLSLQIILSRCDSDSATPQFCSPG
jgi:hypothetical protein